MKTTFTTFFRSSIHKAKTLLQDGDQLNAAFTAADKLKGNAKESVRIHKISFTNATTATVTFTLYAAQPGAKPMALLGADPPYVTGQSLLIGGKWLVAKTTFCKLVGYGGTQPVGCT